MATAYPANPLWSYPLVRSLEFDTRIVASEGGNEQRWSRTAGVETLELPYPRLTLAQRDTMLTFIDACKGTFAQDISITVGAVTLAGCYLDMDRFACVERVGGQWDLKLSLRQITRTPDAGSLASAFPVLSTGARVQLPFTHERDFAVESARSDGGRSVWYHRATPRRSWSAGGSALTDAEAQAIWDHFSRARGRWGSFSFTDPDSGSTHTVRFDQDRLEWRYLSKGVNAVEVKLTQVI